MKNNEVKSTPKKSSWTIKLGLLLIAAALLLCTANFQAAAHAEQTAAQTTADLLEIIPTAAPLAAPVTDSEQEIPDHILNPDMAMPDENINGTEYIGILTIPALDLTLPISEDWSYAKLKNSPCRFDGSAYTDDLVIAAHNYPAHFGHLSDLHIGDDISLCDIDGFRFDYRVASAEIIAADEANKLYDGDWELTLFTCTVGGQNRLCIRCERLS